MTKRRTIDLAKGLLRVFPTTTAATPRDNYCRYGPPDMLDQRLGISAIHVSATFSWDIQKARQLADEWSGIAPTQIGGPAFGDPGAEFTPGQYLAAGHVITSRGCPNRCWFCDVPKREGELREIPITGGWKIHDSNLLACSRTHIEKVFEMLKAQKERVQFVGGLEAARLESWHIEKLASVKTDRVYFSYDQPQDLEAIRYAGREMQRAGFTRSHHLLCYVLIGYPCDSISQADDRLRKAWAAGFVPYAMLYRDKMGRAQPGEWRRFQRLWVRPAIIKTRMKSANE